MTTNNSALHPMLTGTTLPTWNEMTHQERNYEAMVLAAAVENKLGIKRPAQNKRGNHNKLDTEVGNRFGVSRSTWWRYRHGDLANGKRGQRYMHARHEMHAFVTGDTPKPEAPTDHTTVTPETENVGLNFRVPPDFAREFRVAAAIANQKQNAFLTTLLDKHTNAPTNGATAPDDQAIATQLEQWLDRVKCIENRMDQLEAEWKHKLQRTHARHDAKNDAKAKKEIDALKKLHEEAIAAVNERLDSLAKHNKQLQTAWWKRWI